jgi:hypothetical protein
MLPGEHLGFALPRLWVSVRGDETFLLGLERTEQLNVVSESQRGDYSLFFGRLFSQKHPGGLEQLAEPLLDYLRL